MSFQRLGYGDGFIAFRSLGKETCELLDRLLTCNPRERITAAEALDHDYFWTDPLPADPKMWGFAQYSPSIVLSKADDLFLLRALVPGLYLASTYCVLHFLV